MLSLLNPLHLARNAAIAALTAVRVGGSAARAAGGAARTAGSLAGDLANEGLTLLGVRPSEDGFSPSADATVAEARPSAPARVPRRAPQPPPPRPRPPAPPRRANAAGQRPAPSARPQAAPSARPQAAPSDPPDAAPSDPPDAAPSTGPGRPDHERAGARLAKGPVAAGTSREQQQPASALEGDAQEREPASAASVVRDAQEREPASAASIESNTHPTDATTSSTERPPAETAPEDVSDASEQPSRRHSQHIDEEETLVAAVADPGAEEAAGAEVHVDPPWPNYGKMRSREIVERLAVEPEAVVSIVALYERAHRGRRSVLDAAERELTQRSAAPSAAS